MFFTLLLFLASLYVIEVAFGSCLGMFNAELGYDLHCEEVTQLSNFEFFMQLFPIVLGVAGFLFLLSQMH